MDQVKKWHHIVENKDTQQLSEILSDEVVFFSPILFKPQQGKVLTTMYLTGAMHILLNGTFEYINEVHSDSYSVFEFEAVVDQIQINGVDIICWDSEGKINQFKVMIRPYSAINILKEKMARLLETMQPIN
ncbi:MAG: nuclear transport factor 2 family protein [Saprospiraceae bacterium]|nr:nuclear transport factor 2 family protein [Saprospiraceae bacterium]